MENENNVNKGTQNTDQTGVNNNSGNNQNTQSQSNNNQQQSSTSNTQKQNNQNTGGTGANTFTQEQVNRMMANEKNQGRSAAYREMGIDPNDTNTLNMFKAFLSAMQTPEQQAQNQSAQQQIKIAEAESRAKKAEAKAEAMQLGMNPQYVDDAVVIIMSKLNDKTDVKTVVNELKAKYPVWFEQGNMGTEEKDNSSGSTGSSQQNKNTGQNGTGSSVGNASKKGGKSNGYTGIGARLAQQKVKNNSNQKSSFWE